MMKLFLSFAIVIGGTWYLSSFVPYFAALTISFILMFVFRDIWKKVL